MSARPKPFSHLFGPFMVSNRKFGKMVPLYFSIGIKTWPVVEAEVSVELDGAKSERMTATRILAGGALLGPVGMILGGMAKKDITKGRMILHVNGEHVQTYEFPGKDFDKATAFVESVARAQAGYSEEGATAPAAAAAPARPTSPPPPPVSPAVWAADPAGRHQLRWWDGARWTEHVSDAGQQSTDPLT